MALSLLSGMQKNKSKQVAFNTSLKREVEKPKVYEQIVYIDTSIEGVRTRYKQMRQLLARPGLADEESVGIEAGPLEMNKVVSFSRNDAHEFTV